MVLDVILRENAIAVGRNFIVGSLWSKLGFHVFEQTQK
jgi:hypothetical protein